MLEVIDLTNLARIDAGRSRWDDGSRGQTDLAQGQSIWILWSNAAFRRWRTPFMRGRRNNRLRQVWISLPGSLWRFHPWEANISRRLATVVAQRCFVRDVSDWIAGGVCTAVRADNFTVSVEGGVATRRRMTAATATRLAVVAKNRDQFWRKKLLFGFDVRI